MASLSFPAKLNSIKPATEFLNKILEEAGCSQRDQNRLNIALDELMSNVARYAYAPGTEGDIKLSVDVKEDPKRVVLTLTDNGIPYDPLKKEDPDVTLSAEERDIGGLGIFIVKKFMDGITYNHINNQNIVTITKNL